MGQLNQTRSTTSTGFRDFVSLSAELRTHVDTACAAYHLGRQPQTMRSWASKENGPLRPTRIHGRLAWKVSEIKRLLLTDD